MKKLEQMTDNEIKAIVPCYGNFDAAVEECSEEFCDFTDQCRVRTAILVSVVGDEIETQEQLRIEALERRAQLIRDADVKTDGVMASEVIDMVDDPTTATPSFKRDI